MAPDAEAESEAQPPPRAATLARIARFGLVGLLGVAVNEGVLVLMHGGLGLALALASPIAIEASILGNFVLNSRWTWRYDFGRSRSRWLHKALQYHASAALAAFLGNYLLLLALVHFTGLDYRIANLIGIAAGSAVNYFAADLWVFRRRDADAGPGDLPG